MLPLIKAVNSIKPQPRTTEPADELSEKVLNGLVVGAVGLGTFLLFRKVYRDIKKRARQKKALIPGNPASDAIQLKMAFENDNMLGWGTNEEQIFQVLESIPDSHHLRKVQKAYRDLYNTDLVLDMQSDLDTEEFAKALAIINTKP